MGGLLRRALLGSRRHLRRRMRRDARRPEAERDARADATMALEASGQRHGVRGHRVLHILRKPPVQVPSHASRYHHSANFINKKEVPGSPIYLFMGEKKMSSQVKFSKTHTGWS